MLLLITIIFLMAYAGLIFFYYRHWKAAKEFVPGTNGSYSFISIIVAARNEEDHITSLLDALHKQQFPHAFFEVIVVDDFSSDKTAELVRSHPLSQIRLLQPAADPTASSKKKAIESGIAAAKGELIITTDADCIPGTEWLSTMHAFYQQKQASFIAAPVKFTHDNSFLQLFQAIDFLVLQGITASSVTSHFHTMCNGANLSYKKSSFISVNGFEGIDAVATGDDMLLMYKIWKQDPNRVFYLKNRKTIMMTAPMKSWKTFFMQRKRWASKTLVYDDKRILVVLGFVYVFNFFFLLLLIAAFMNPFNWWLVLAFLLVKTIIELPFIYSVARFFGEEGLLRYFFFFQPMHIFYTVFTGLTSQFGRYEWKGRRTK